MLGLLYLGCTTLWYHVIAGGLSRAKILHVQAVDAAGQWQDPTICKLSPVDLLRSEADAHATFARYIGESVPQRIGDPVFVGDVGGMVLELVGACWRLPELAHTQANLSNTFAETIKYDSDHAADGTITLAHAGAEGKADSDCSAPPAGRVRDRLVFGEVRIVIDEVVLGQLNTVLVQSAHREPGTSLVEHYGLAPKLSRVLARKEDDSRALGPSARGALSALLAAIEAAEAGGVAAEPEGYPGPWFAIVHGDLHGGNIMVDSRSYAWLIDYGEVEDAHVFKDPAKLEARSPWP